MPACASAAEEHVGERFDGLPLDEPGVDRRRHARDDEAMAVTLLDLVPRLPAEHGGSLHDDDALHRRVDAGVEERSAPEAELLEGV